MRPEKVSRKTTNLGRLILLPLALLASNAFAQNPVPFVNQPLVPSAVAPGGPSFTLTVNGAGFVSGATVNWNGTPLTTTFVSSAQLTATVPAANTAINGTASVTVVNPGPGGGASNVAFLQISVQQFSPIALVYPSSLGSYAGDSAYPPLAVVAADFNGDGRLDLVAADTVPSGTNPGAFYILLGNGDGTFEQQTDYVDAAPFYGIAVGDFNGDGKLDLAVTGPGAAQVSVLLGNGDGTFQPPVHSPAGPSPYAFVAGDFNGDGKLDLAVTNSAGSTVSILLGNGDGTFQAPVSSTVGGVPLAIATGDFTGHGKLDLVVVNESDNTVSVLLGDGDGTFQNHVDYATGPGPSSVVAADFNGDGKLDLAVANSGGTTVSVLLGNGDGTFQPHVDYPTATSPEAIVAGDFNADGKLDLAAAGLGGTLSVLLGKGDGTFQPHADYVTHSAMTRLVAGDLNGDGLPDFVYTNVQRFTTSLILQLQIATVTLTPLNPSLGNQTLGTTSLPIQLTLTNNGASDLAITGIAISGTNSSDFAQTNTCPMSPATLAAGASCTINVTFTPTATGSRSALLSVTDNGPGGQQNAGLSGTGVNPVAALSPTSLSFASQNVGTTSAAQTVTLTNTGVGPLAFTGTGITVSGANPGDFAQTNNCGTSVAQGASCAINVTFTPTTGGTRTGALTFTDNAANSPQTLSLAGTGVPPTVTLSATTLTFGSYGIGITSPAQTVTVSNNGPGPLTVTSVTATGDFAQTNNCLGTVAASASCTISVTFTPTAGGTRAGFVTITDNAVASPQTVTLSGTGVPPAASASPASLNFGNVAVGTTSTAQSVTLTNSGPGPLAISGISVGGTNASDFPQTNNCPGSLAASASCTINVTFKPSLNSAESGTLTISDNAASNPQTVSLSGTGQAPVASLSPASLDFPGQSVGVMSGPQAVTLTNSGALALTVSGVLVTSPFVQSNNCPASPATLAPGSSCTITLTFTAAFAGTTFGSLYVSDNSLSGAQQTVTLTGEATVSFGNEPVGQTSAAQPVAVANGSTTTTVTVTGATATGDFAVVSNSCGALPPGGSCAPTVTFTPTAPGTRTGALMVSISTGSALSVPLTGTGLGATATLSKSSVAFGSQLVGTTSSATAVTVTNNGNQALNFTTIAASGDFNVAASGTTCAVGTAVAAGANCTISVTFTPTAGGARTGAVTLANNASDSPQSVALSGTGEDFSIGPASGSPTTQSVSAGQTATYNLTISPAGGFTGTATLTCTGAPTGATCTPSPSSLSLSGTSATDATVTVTTTAKTMSLPSWRWDSPVASPRARGHAPVLWLITLALLALAWSRRRCRPRETCPPRKRGSGDPWIPAGACPVDSRVRGNDRGVDSRVRGNDIGAGMTSIRGAIGPLALAAVLLLVVIWAACGGGGGAAPPPSAAGVSLSASSLTFSSQNMGTTSGAQTVTLTTSGNAALSITGIALAGANSGDFAETNTCDGQVPAGANCQIKVTFSPTATGTRTGSVTITDDATGSPQSISLSGAGVPPATPAGAYTLTVTATLTSSSGTLTHTIPLTLTVN